MTKIEETEKNIANQIRKNLCALRQAIKSGDESKIMIWPIPAKLACAQRPLRDHPVYGGSAKVFPPEATPYVLAWIKRIKDEGIKSIICLMHPKEFQYYERLNLHTNGLIGLYSECGFAIRHFPWADPAHEQSEAARLELKNKVHKIKIDAYEAYRELPHPVLVHCSAGIDRSAPVAAFIVLKELNIN
jgi:hypothetical protein